MTGSLHLGILGGTFNPVHLAHLRVAEEVRQELGLDSVIFMPARLPPHKDTNELADAAHRLELVRLATADNPAFEVSDMELRREGSSYSVDTLEAVRDLYRPGSLWFIMGLDAYLELHTWKEHRRILELADLLVVRRPPCTGDIAPPAGSDGDFRRVAPNELLNDATGRRVRLFEATQLDISSTAIRSALAGGRSIRYMVPEPVRLALEAQWRNAQVGAGCAGQTDKSED